MPQGGQWAGDAPRARRAQWTFLRITAGAAFLAGTLVMGVPPVVPATPASVTAADESRFEASPIQGAFVQHATPIGVDPGQPVTVMLKLAGDPVAVSQSKVGRSVTSPAA